MCVHSTELRHYCTTLVANTIESSQSYALLPSRPLRVCALPSLLPFVVMGLTYIVDACWRKKSKRVESGIPGQRKTMGDAVRSSLD